MIDVRTDAAAIFATNYRRVKIHACFRPRRGVQNRYALSASRLGLSKAGWHLVVNLKTAKQLGITIPPEVLYRATEVIK